MVLTGIYRSLFIPPPGSLSIHTVALDLRALLNLLIQMKHLNLHLIVLALAAIITSCGGEPEQTGPKYNFERADSLPSGYLEELGIVKTNIEVTAKLFARMNEQGYAFNESALLPAGKNYSGSSKQAMGIGATGSDLVYAASYGQNQSAMDRMKGLVSIAGSLGVGEAFDEELLGKMASDDTTINKSVLLTKAYLKAKDQLFSDERAQYATFMVVGGWIEGLHIGCQALKGKEITDQEIKIGFWELCNGYGNVLHMCEVFQSNQEMTGIAAQLKEIGPQLEAVRKNAKKYNDANVTALADAVSKIRGSLI